VGGGQGLVRGALLGLRGLHPCRELLAAGEQRVALVAAGLADLLAERPLLRAQPVRGGDGPAPPLVGGQQRVHESDVLTAGALRRPHPLGVLAQHSQIDHDR